MKTDSLIEADSKEKAFKELSFKDQFSRQSTAKDGERASEEDPVHELGGSHETRGSFNLNETQSSLIKQEQ